MKTDYPELEGKEVTVTNEGETFKCIVIGCNYDIGITLVQKRDPSIKEMCLPGPSSKYFMGGDWYDEMFYYYTEKIQKGYVNAEAGSVKRSSIQKGYNGSFNSGMASCPYS